MSRRKSDDEEKDGTHFAWFPALMKLVAPLSNFLHCPTDATTRDAKVSM